MASYFAFMFESGHGGYIGFFPDFPEGFTQGDTVEECVDMLQDVLNICAEEYTIERRAFPNSSNFKAVLGEAIKYRNDGENSVEKEETPIIQLFKVPNMETKPVKVTVSFPKNVLEIVDKKAEALGMTRSGFLAKSALEA